jgi:hypothetical protein
MKRRERTSRNEDGRGRMHFAEPAAGGQQLELLQDYFDLHFADADGDPVVAGDGPRTS